MSGGAANLGKTQVFNAQGGPAPPGIADLGPEVWQGDRAEAERGFVALGTPIGCDEFVRRSAAQCLEAERDLLRELEGLPDLQNAWLLLLQCASPRAQHVFRTVPCHLSAEYAAAHDDAVWHTLQRLLGDRGRG